jgi:hypothetical protein
VVHRIRSLFPHSHTLLSGFSPCHFYRVRTIAFDDCRYSLGIIRAEWRCSRTAPAEIPNLTVDRLDFRSFASLRGTCRRFENLPGSAHLMTVLRTMREYHWPGNDEVGQIKHRQDDYNYFRKTKIDFCRTCMSAVPWVAYSNDDNLPSIALCVERMIKHLERPETPIRASSKTHTFVSAKVQ